MADFLKRLVGRTLGMTPAVQPVLTPMFGTNTSTHESTWYEGIDTGIDTGQAQTDTNVGTIPAGHPLNKHAETSPAGHSLSGHVETIPPDNPVGHPLGRNHALPVQMPKTTRSNENPLQESHLTSLGPGPLPTQFLEKPFKDADITPTGTGQAQHTTSTEDEAKRGRRDTNRDRTGAVGTGLAPVLPLRPLPYPQQEFSSSPLPVRTEGLAYASESFVEESNRTEQPPGIGRSPIFPMAHRDQIGREEPAAMQTGEPVTRTGTSPFPASSQGAMNDTRIMTSRMGVRSQEVVYAERNDVRSEEDGDKSRLNAPTIQVAIGRIEVRATPPAPAPPAQRTKPAVMGLEEYLDQRAKGVR